MAGSARFTWKELLCLAYLHGKNDMHEDYFKDWLEGIAAKNPGINKKAR